MLTIGDVRKAIAIKLGSDRVTLTDRGDGSFSVAFLSRGSTITRVMEEGDARRLLAFLNDHVDSDKLS